jgi:hypothetical protein
MTSSPYSAVTNHSFPEARPPSFLPKSPRARLLTGTRPQTLAQANVDASVQRVRAMQADAV